MNKLSALLSAFLLIASASSCGGAEFSSADSEAGGGGGKGGSSSAGKASSNAGSSGISGGMPSGGGSAVSGPCPPVEPQAGTSCALNGLHCSYGTDPRPSCRNQFTCTASRWSAPPTTTCQRDSSCPMVPPTSGTDCVGLEQVCTYPGDGIVCGCPMCTMFCTSPRWLCFEPPGGPCPKLLPNAGEPCDNEDVLCEYGECRLGAAVQATCPNGSWAWQPVACAVEG